MKTKEFWALGECVINFMSMKIRYPIFHSYTKG